MKLTKQKSPRCNGGSNHPKQGQVKSNLATSLYSKTKKSSWHDDLIAQVEAPEVIGTRYDESRQLIPKLIWWGYYPDEAFSMMREKYSSDYNDSAIWSTIRWAEKNVTPREEHASFRPTFPRKKLNKPKPVGFKCDYESILASVSECRWDHYDFFEASRICLEGPETDQRFIVDHLFREGDLIALTGRYKDPDVVKSKSDWIEFLKHNPAPHSDDGGWFYINPVKSNHGHHIKRQDIKEFRHVLLDGDELPREHQLQILGCLIPCVAAIVDTANRGYHAVVRLDAKDLDEYSRRADKMFTMLSGLKFDPATKHPLTKCRMPYVHRKQPDKGVDGWQRLIYLNPNPTEKCIFSNREEVA